MTPVEPALASDESDFDISDEADVRALFAAEDRHFWHRSRNRMIAGHLRRLGKLPGSSVLELGCGGGCVASHLSTNGYRVTGVEGHASLLRQAQRRAPDLSLKLFDLRADLAKLDLPTFDVVALFDVIEHLEHPFELLERAFSRVAEGGVLVGTVPALMSLWSKIDEHAGHKRRYSARSLQTLLWQLQSDDVEVRSFNRLLVPLLWVQRKAVGRHGDARGSIQNLAVPPAPLNRALYELALAEDRLSPLLRRVPGSSLWFAVRKRLRAEPESRR